MWTKKTKAAARQDGDESEAPATKVKAKSKKTKAAARQDGDESETPEATEAKKVMKIKASIKAKPTGAKPTGA